MISLVELDQRSSRTIFSGISFGIDLLYETHSFDRHNKILRLKIRTNNSHKSLGVPKNEFQPS